MMTTSRHLETITSEGIPKEDTPAALSLSFYLERDIKMYDWMRFMTYISNKILKHYERPKTINSQIKAE